MKNKALLFDPYLDSLGGGEFYTLKTAQVLKKQGFQVFFAWKDRKIFKEIKKRFAFFDIKDFQIDKKLYSLFCTQGNLLKKYTLTKKYHTIFYLSDGSIPFLFSENNILHFQVPFQKKLNFLEKLKLKNIDNVICNSFFTKKIIDKNYQLESRVIYPPLNSVFFKKSGLKKENIILSVGRFDGVLNVKNHDVLIQVFKSLVDQGLKSWNLVLVGAIKKKNSFFNKLKKSAKNYPIEIIANASFQKLKDFYNKSKIYWHAAGFGQDLKNNPHKAEHFGISVVEAMASKCVPIVFNGGGLREIVQEETGFLWNDIKDFQNKTLKMIKYSRKRRETALRAQKKARQFDEKIFFQKMKLIIL